MPHILKPAFNIEASNNGDCWRGVICPNGCLWSLKRWPFDPTSMQRVGDVAQIGKPVSRSSFPQRETHMVSRSRSALLALSLRLRCIQVDQPWLWAIALGYVRQGIKPLSQYNHRRAMAFWLGHGPGSSYQQTR